MHGPDLFFSKDTKSCKILIGMVTSPPSSEESAREEDHGDLIIDAFLFPLVEEISQESHSLLPVQVTCKT